MISSPVSVLILFIVLYNNYPGVNVQQINFEFNVFKGFYELKSNFLVLPFKIFFLKNNRI